MSHLVCDALGEVDNTSVVTLAGGVFAFFAVFNLRDDKIILSMYSIDEAKIGVIAHDPMLLNDSCDNIIFGCCTNLTCDKSKLQKYKQTKMYEKWHTIWK